MADITPSSFIIHSSALTPLQIFEKLKTIFQEKEITLFTLIDHSGEAHKAGLELPYEQLLIFGDPRTGTLLMQENPAIGIELPLKFLLWLNSEGITQIAYKDPGSFAVDYGIKKNAGILQKMRAALDTLIDLVKK